MKLLVLVVAAMSPIVAAGCNRATSEQSNDSSKAPTAKITIARGCLTGSDGQFALTNLEHRAPQAGTAKPPSSDPISTTESYKLVGMDDRLRGMVGQRVEVTGDATPGQVVDFVSATPANPPAGTAGTSGSDARVSTASRARVEIQELRVRSASPLGETCP